MRIRFQSLRPDFTAKRLSGKAWDGGQNLLKANELRRFRVPKTQVAKPQYLAAITPPLSGQPLSVLRSRERFVADVPDNLPIVDPLCRSVIVELSTVVMPPAATLFGDLPMHEESAVPIPASAIADRDLSDGALRVLLYLAHRTGDGSELVMRHQDLAAELHRSISTVARSLEELAMRGYIARGRDRSVRGGPARI
jgi:hypothetical protein